MREVPVHAINALSGDSKTAEGPHDLGGLLYGGARVEMVNVVVECGYSRMSFADVSTFGSENGSEHACLVQGTQLVEGKALRETRPTRHDDNDPAGAVRSGFG